METGDSLRPHRTQRTKGFPPEACVFVESKQNDPPASPTTTSAEGETDARTEKREGWGYSWETRDDTVKMDLIDHSKALDGCSKGISPREKKKINHSCT